MRRDEWQRAFGSTPEVFERRVQDTLNNLQEEKKMKKKLSVTLAIALAAVLALTGTAFAVANGMGILDFMDRYGKSAPQISEVIEEAQGDSVSTSRVRYTAQEVVFNGETVQMTVVCEPLDPEHVMLVGVDELEDDLRMANGDSVSSAYETADPSWVPVKEYAEQNHLEMVCAEAMISINGCSLDYVSKDGKLYYYIRGTFEQEDRPELGEDGKYHLAVVVCDSPRAERDPKVEREELDVAVEGRAAQDKQVLTFDKPIDMGAYTIDGIEISASRQETALNLRYTVREDLTDAEKLDMEDLTFKLMKDDRTAADLNFWGGGTRPLDVKVSGDKVRSKKSANPSDGAASSTGEKPTEGGAQSAKSANPSDGAASSTDEEPTEDGAQSAKSANPSDGAASSTGEGPTGYDMSGRSFFVTLSYDSLEELPEHFYVRPYHYTKGEYGKLIVLSTVDGMVEVKDVPVEK